MTKIEISALDLAQRFIGVSEVAGTASSPHVLAMVRWDLDCPEGDDVPWCSAFMNYITWLLRLPRSKSLRARVCLLLGGAIPTEEARAGFDVVILKRGGGNQPGPDVINSQGHVGLFAGIEGGKVLVLGGNQTDEVNVSRYPVGRLLGIRRLV